MQVEISNALLSLRHTRLTKFHHGPAPVIATSRGRAGRVKTAKRRSAAQGSLEAPKRPLQSNAGATPDSIARANTLSSVFCRTEGSHRLTRLAAPSGNANSGGMCRRRTLQKDGAILESAAGAGLRVPLFPATGDETRSFGFSHSCVVPL